jgi:uncharacterized protein (TIGR03435 family)
MSATLFNHLWQSTLCVGVAALLACAFRNAGAHVRYGIWLAASLKFLVPFSLLAALGSHIGWSTPERTVATVFTAAQAIAAPLSEDAPSQMVTYTSTPSGGLGNWLLAAWIAGAAALATRWLLRWNTARVVVKRATPAPLNAPFRVRSTPIRVQPGVFGIFRPTLLLPENIFESLPPAHLQALLAHEAAHVKRHDNLTAALHSLTECLFWFHPLVWWLGARLVAERERACDEAVVRVGHDRSDYARAILGVCRLYLGAPVVSASGASRGPLRTRIEAILNSPVSAPLGTARRCVLAAAATITLAVPIVLGLANPARAEPAADSPAASTFKFSTVRILRGEDAKPATVSAGPDRFIALNASVRDLVRFAHGHRLPPQVSGGPGWLDTERYTIHANVDPAALTDGSVTPASIQEPVRLLLEERFHLRTHVTKGPVYVLESAENGPASSQKPVQKGIGLIDRKRGNVSFRGASSASVAEALSTFLSSQVLDHTKPGVTYDFKMKWPRNDLKALGDQLHDQAGLTLKSFMLEQLVIDGAERPTLDAGASSAEQIATR